MGLIPVPEFTSIKLVGVENLERPGRDLRCLRFYGHRPNDAARRLVMIVLPMKEAAELMQEAGEIGDFPEVEIEDRFWTYVAVIGAHEARFRKEEENGPSA